jgi:hypothetical protein
MIVSLKEKINISNDIRLLLIRHFDILKLQDMFSRSLIPKSDTILKMWHFDLNFEINDNFNKSSDYKLGLDKVLKGIPINL